MHPLPDDLEEPELNAFRILAIAQVPDAIAEFITTYTSSKILIIAGMVNFSGSRL